MFFFYATVYDIQKYIIQNICFLSGHLSMQMFVVSFAGQKAVVEFGSVCWSMVSVNAWLWFFLGHYGLLKSCPIIQVICVPQGWCVHMQKKYKTETSCHVLETLAKIICTVIFKSDF